MRWKIGISLLCLACLSLPGRAQLQRILHQTFETDSIYRIELGIDGEVEAKTWAGNNILTEAEVKLYDGTPGIFEHVIALGRYQIAADTLAPGSMLLRFQNTERPPIRTVKGECFEEFILTIYIPDRFRDMGNGLWSSGRPAVPTMPSDTLPAAKGGNSPR